MLNERQPLSIGAIVAVLAGCPGRGRTIIYLTYFASYSSLRCDWALMAILFVIWIFNIVILLGAEIDVEILRARQLVAGIPAEEQVQIRPRSVSTVEKQTEKHVASVDDGKVLRRSLSVVHRQDGQDDDTNNA